MNLYEKIWIWIAVMLVAIFIGSILATTAFTLSEPPSHMEMINPSDILSNKSIWNPGIQEMPDGSILVTMTARIWSFLPDHVKIPVGKKVTFRVTSSDVIHGFEIVGTNVNMMAVPGYINQVTTQFQNAGSYLLLCNEYCGIGHHNMSTTLEVTIAKKEKP